MSHNRKSWKSGVTAEQYDSALGCVEKRSPYYINEIHVK